MSIRKSKKTIWTLMLAVAVVLLSFGSAWAATATVTDAWISANNGAILPAQTTAPNDTAQTTAYFVAGTTSGITTVITLNATGWASDGTANVAVAGSGSDDDWTVTTTTLDISTNNITAGKVTLTRTGTSTFDTTETVIFTITHNTESVTVYAEITPEPVTLTTSPISVTLYNGATYTAETIVVTPSATGTGTYKWTDVLFAKNVDGSNDVATTEDIGDPATGITTTYDSSTPVTITLAGAASSTMALHTYHILAKSLTLQEAGVNNDIPVAGIVSDNNGTVIGKADIEIADTSMKLGQTIKGFVVGATPATGTDDITVSIGGLGSRNIASLFIAPVGTAPTTDTATLGTLNITATNNTSNGTIKFSGTAPATAMSEQYTIQATLNDTPSATVVTGVLTVKIVESDEAIDSTWTITDLSDNSATLQIGTQSKIILTSPLSLTLGSTGAVIVNLPDGTTENLDPYVAGSDGYQYIPNPDGGTIIEIFYTPTMDGEIGLDIIYSLDGGSTTKTQSITGVGSTPGGGSGGSGSSSSCSVGFGVAGILALAGFAFARKRAR